MKAIVRAQYGSLDAVRIAEVPMPAPAAGEALIKLSAASVNPLGLFLVKGAPWNRLPGLRTPKELIIGCDIAGRVEAVGAQATQFHPGDEIYGMTGFDGKGFAEYVCAPESQIGLKPTNLSFAQAAAVPVAAITALQGLRDHGQIKPNSKVLIEGASGGVGTFAVQIAKALGAEVTAVCSARNADIARSLGADHILDYALTDFTRSGRQYDLILGISLHHSLFECRRALTPNGVHITIGGPVSKIFPALATGLLLSRLGPRKFKFFIAKNNQKDLAFLKDLFEAGKITSVIDRTYPMSEAAEALRYLAEGHAQGKIVLTV
jgi:NADPH:quinone reductase-like Zn-dependent oxidoreductase